MDLQYRRNNDIDESMRLLLTLNERVAAMQETIKTLTNKPCDLHALRLHNIEKILWFAIASIFLLTLKAAFSFFVA